MAVETKQIILSDVSGHEIKPTLESDEHPRGYMVHGNIYVAAADDFDNLVGDNFPKSKSKGKTGSRQNKLTIDGVAVDYMTPEELLDKLNFDPDVVKCWAQEKREKQRILDAEDFLRVPE